MDSVTAPVYCRVRNRLHRGSARSKKSPPPVKIGTVLDGGHEHPTTVHDTWDPCSFRLYPRVPMHEKNTRPAFPICVHMTSSPWQSIVLIRQCFPHTRYRDMYTRTEPDTAITLRQQQCATVHADNRGADTLLFAKYGNLTALRFATARVSPRNGVRCKVHADCGKATSPCRLCPGIYTTEALKTVVRTLCRLRSAETCLPCTI